MGLLYQDLIRSGQLTASGQLSPVLPLVLYNGVRRWRAPEEVAELVATVPGGLERYCPRLRYFLLDEGRFTEDDPTPLRNLAAALFRLENSRTPTDVQRVLRALIGWLKAAEQRHLRRVFTVWLRRVFLPERRLVPWMRPCGNGSRRRMRRHYCFGGSGY